MRKIKEVLRLKFESQLSEHEIAYSCQISRTTVRDYLKRAASAGLDWSEASALNEVRIIERLFPVIVDSSAMPGEERPLPDFQYIYDQLKTYRKYSDPTLVGVQGSPP
jgi:hypothetical protein